MKKTDWPRKQLGQMRRRRPKRNVLLERQSGKRRSSTTTRMAKNSALPLKLRRKPKRNV